MINVGDYVRAGKFGIIRAKDYHIKLLNTYESSPDITDLIKLGDIIKKTYKTGLIEKIPINKIEDIDNIKRDFKDGFNLSILTREQFESNSYKVSAYGSIDLDELNKTVERLNKIPNYDDLMKENNKLQSNWNSLRECIEENKKVAMEYTRKIELSDLCQGDYPVPYYYAIKRIDLDNLYLDKMNELEGKDKDE